MANTYSTLIAQAVFAVKYRNALIQDDWKKELFGIIGNLINEKMQDFNRQRRFRPCTVLVWI